MNPNDLKVSTRLSLGFGATLALTLAVIACGVFGLATLESAATELAHDRVPKLTIGADWEISVLQSARHMRNVLILEGRGEVDKELAALEEERKLRKAYLEQLQKTVNTEAGRAALQAIVEVRSAYLVQEEAFIKLAAAGDLAQAKKVLLESARPLQIRNIDEIAKFIDLQKKFVAEKSSGAEQAYRQAIAYMLALGGVAIVLGCGVSFAIGRGLGRQLGGEPAAAADLARAVAQGRLNTVVDLRRGDTSSLLAALGEMRQSLARVVSEVRGNSENVATASAQIAQGNADLSQRTEQQASALQQTAATMDELGTTVRNNADNARQAQQLSLSARSIAGQGGDVVRQVVEKMKGINDSSRRIADIISVIDGIAFQTNILALNAAVEAARAGEQGRGFAVVAAEVRSLAQRSAAAAKEIKTLITDSVEQVEQGSALVGKAGETMTEIVGAIQRVTDIVGEISAASAEQSTGVSQVGQVVAQLDQTTQHNAALVEESAAAADNLRQQAGQLVQTVAVFELG